MTLSDKQRLFVINISKLIAWAYDNGYAFTFGDAFRDPRLHGDMGEKKGYGHPKSNHKIRLAVDLNLFKEVNGQWLYCSSTEDHRPIGEKWEAMNPMNRWGGRFQDGNHYSMEHEGTK